MTRSTEIRVSQETVNDDTVTIASWRAANGGRVRSKEIIAHIETSKAVLEVEAEQEGYLEILHPEGAEVAIRELIGMIHSEPFDPKAVNSYGQSQRTSEETRISNKARLLVEKHNIDVSVFKNQGLVREVDVIRYMEQEAFVSGEEDPAGREKDGLIDQESMLDGDHLTLKGSLWHDVRASAGERGKGLAWVFLNYLFRNWLLGNLVRWSPRGIILPLHRLRGVKMGVGCFIDPSAIVETAYAENITIGDDVRITAGAIIMTHIKPPHYLRDTGLMPAAIKPVILEDHCFIGVSAVIMPGVTVGKASVVASGSVVVGNVPPFTMVAGNPAKVIRRFSRPDEA